MILKRDVVAGSRAYQFTATAMADGRTAICLRSGPAGARDLNELSGTIAKEDLAMVAGVFKPELAAIAAWHQIPFDDGAGILARRRKLHPNAYAPWTTQQEELLTEMHQRGAAVREIARTLGRQVGAITARMQKLGLDNPSE